MADDPFSIVAVTTSPSGVVSGSIMMKGETHAIEYREGSTYSVYKVCPHTGARAATLLACVVV